jgi:serine phosphatase RsbU (regulator of sigma subunit)/anti-anti-sigma regulatory factor
MSVVPRPEGERERLKALHELAILDTLPEEAYDDITRIAAQICNVPIALVSLVDEDRQWFKSKVGLDLVGSAREHAFCAHAILAPDSLMVVEDARTDPRFATNPFVTAPGGIRFYAGAPLVTSDGHALGTLCVIDHKVHSISGVQQETLRALARQVVSHLELRRMVRQLEQSRDELSALCDALERQASAADRDLHRAELIQRSLLPHRMPRLDGCCIQSLYRPGRSVGGDLFDVARVGERHVALVIADAAGHGLSAALLALLFRHHLRLADALGRPVRPGDVLARINQGLRANAAPPGMFVTAVVALLDLEKRELMFASAGHPPVLRMHDDGALETLTQTGPALGLFDDATYEELRIRLDPRDRVLFYTDGLMEWRPGGPVQPAEVARTLARVGRRRDALAVLAGEIADSTPSADRDDMTALLLDLAPGESCCLEPTDAPDNEPAVATPDPAIRHGESVDATFLVLGGRVTWQYADAFLEAALGVLDSRRPLVLDLADAEQVDSTMLGTLHDLVTRADALGVPLIVQRVPESVAAAFAELSLGSVQSHVSAASAALPAALTVLEITPRDLRHHRERLLKAHQVLAGLSEHNRDLFAEVIGAMASESERRRAD